MSYFYSKLSITLLILGLSFTPSAIHAQEFVEKITNAFEFDLGEEREDSTFAQTKLVLAPIMSFEPTTSFGFGIGAKLLFKPFGAGADTRTSNIPVSLRYTLKNQFIALSEFTIFLPHEKYLFKGEIGFSKFPIGYFGIGNTSADEDQIDVSFDNLLIEPLFLRRVAPNFFVGGGWRYNSFSNFKLLETEDNEELEHLLRDSLTSVSSGIEIAASFDSRDNVLNAGTGVFVEFTHGFYNPALGSSSQFMLTKFDYRRYWTISEQRPYDAIAFQFFTRLTWGDTGALELSALGGPEILRGFSESRFRDNYSFFSQVEYRWQALDRIGFVFYGGVGNVTNQLTDLDLGNAHYSLGSGIRLKIVKSENLNIRLDYAFGFGGGIHDQNFYLGIAEAF